MRYLYIVLFSISVFGQQNPKVDFISLKASLTPNEIEKSIAGNVIYNFNVLSATDTIRIDAQKMEFNSVKINNQEVRFKNSGKQLLLFEGFKTGINNLTFSYKAIPKKALYFIWRKNDLQIWTQGQGKYTSNWLPSFDDVNEKVVFKLSITFKKEFEVIANGNLIGTSISDYNSKTWNFEMQQPMSSYLVMLAIGKFDKTILKSKSKIPLELYLKPSDKTKFESTYKYSKNIFDFLEKEIGVKYPWGIYRQVPIFDFLYAGMENTTSTIFSEDFVVDAVGVNDKNYVNVNAHELAHQWFGDLITAKTGKHHWLQEGFATYYALLVEKNIFGEDYFYSKMYENWEEIRNYSKIDTVPIMNEKASSTTFYKKGALALLVLQTEIGDKKFKKAIKNYLTKYAFKNVITDDFLSEITKVSKYDVEKFKKTFLETSRNDSLYLGYLKKWNQYQYIKQIDAVEYDSERRYKVYATILGDLKIDPSIKMRIFHELVNYKFDDKRYLLDIAFKDKRLEVQKGILIATSEHPETYNLKMDSIFDLPSYSIKRDFFNNTNMLVARRFEKWTKVEGISKNNYLLRIDWLKMALDFQFQSNRRHEFITELNSYTSSNYDMYTQIAARNKAYPLFSENKVAFENLFLATKHHNWQAVGSAKVLIEAYLSREEQRKIVIEFQKTVAPEIQQIIEKYLELIKIGGRIEN